MSAVRVRLGRVVRRGWLAVGLVLALVVGVLWVPPAVSASTAPDGPSAESVSVAARELAAAPQGPDPDDAVAMKKSLPAPVWPGAGSWLVDLSGGEVKAAGAGVSVRVKR